MKKTAIWIKVLCCLLLVACNGKRQERAEEETKPVTFIWPEVPVMVQSPEDRLEFVLRHYWDHFDFKDTVYIHIPDVTEQALANYIGLLAHVPLALSGSCLIRTMQQASQEKKMLDYFANTFRKYLFDANSPLRNEKLYESVCSFWLASPLTDEAVRSRVQHDIKLIGMNRAGSVAADFVYTLSSGMQKRMHDIHSPYILLLFYNPNCHSCAETLAAIKASAILNNPDMINRVKVLAFYPDEDHEAWVRYQAAIPDTWINAYDKDLSVLTYELYDLKAMPVLYLLDKDKKVLLKDTTVGEIEDYFENKSL